MNRECTRFARSNNNISMYLHGYLYISSHIHGYPWVLSGGSRCPLYIIVTLYGDSSLEKEGIECYLHVGQLTMALGWWVLCSLNQHAESERGRGVYRNLWLCVLPQFFRAFCAQCHTIPPFPFSRPASHWYVFISLHGYWYNSIVPQVEFRRILVRDGGIHKIGRDTDFPTTPIPSDNNRNIEWTYILSYVGLLGAIESLKSNPIILDSIISLTWTPPFSLDIPNVDPDITYCVGVVNSTSSLVINSQCGITDTQYNYTVSLDDIMCDAYYIFTVTPVNIVGNGTSASVTGGELGNCEFIKNLIYIAYNI